MSLSSENAGDAPLELTAGSTSCACAISDLKNRTVPPGQSTKVVVEWTPKEFVGKFTQSVRIETNDPLCPRGVVGRDRANHDHARRVAPGVGLLADSAG